MYINSLVPKIRIEVSIIDEIMEFASLGGVIDGDYFSCKEKQFLRRLI